MTILSRRTKLILSFIFLLCFSFVEASPPEPHKWYILTGGPGAGKTSILLYLEQHGFGIVREAATDITNLSLADGKTEPWSKSWFNAKVVHLQCLREETVKTSPQTIFFDRSPVDVIFFEMLKSEPDPHLLKKVNELVQRGIYQRTVFFVDNLDHCMQTEYRVETFEESLRQAERLKEIYRSFGFNLIVIPKGTVEERSKQIMSFIQGDDS